MTEQQREAFERWYNAEYVRPIIPADRTEGGYQHPDAMAAWDAWQAALSHAEGDAVGTLTIDRHGDEKFRALLPAIDLEPGTYEVYTHPAPQVAVPEPVGWVKWFGDEPSFQPRDALLPEDAKQHGWQLVGLMRSMSAPAPDEREIAAKALSDFADRMGAKHGDTENGQFFIDCAEQAHEEVTRLRAGKEVTHDR